jgi:hypothetical protein
VVHIDIIPSLERTVPSSTHPGSAEGRGTIPETLHLSKPSLIGGNR